MSTPIESYDAAIATYEADGGEAAISLLEKILEETPDFALAHSSLAVLYSREGNHDEAMRHAQEVCNIEPDDYLSYVSLSIIARKADLKSAAEEAMSISMQKQWEARMKEQEEAEG